MAVWKINLFYKVLSISKGLSIALSFRRTGLRPDHDGKKAAEKRDARLNSICGSSREARRCGTTENYDALSRIGTVAIPPGHHAE